MATELLGNTQTATYTYMTAPRLNGLSATPSFLPSIVPDHFSDYFLRLSVISEPQACLSELFVISWSQPVKSGSPNRPTSYKNNCFSHVRRRLSCRPSRRVPVRRPSPTTPTHNTRHLAALSRCLWNFVPDLAVSTAVDARCDKPHYDTNPQHPAPG